MNYKFFFSGLNNIILNPAKAWETIYSENRPIKLLRNSFFFPLVVLASVSAFFGSLIYTNVELSPVYSLLVGIKCFCILFFTIYATAYIFSEITYPLDLGKDFNVSFKIIVYSAAPFLICQILSQLFESLIFVNIMGIYGLYIFWNGVEKMLSPPQHKKMPILIATFVTLTGIYIATNIILTMLTNRVYHAFFA